MSSTRDERWKMARETGSSEKCRLTIALRKKKKRERKREEEEKKEKKEKKRNRVRILSLFLSLPLYPSTRVETEFHGVVSESRLTRRVG